MPQKRGFKDSGKTLLNSVIERPEVLLATIACGATCGAIF